MEIEEFGLEDFGAPEPPDVPNVAEVAMLKEMVEELNKQIASTMDEAKQTKLRAAREAVKQQIAGVVNTTSKTDSQWLEMSKAYAEFYGDAGEFKRRIMEKGGVSDICFEELRHELAEAHGAKEPVKATRTRRGAAKPGVVSSAPAPDERFKAANLHAANCRIDGNLLWDEMGLGAITDASVEKFIAEINVRAGGAIEEFGAEDDSAANVGAGNSAAPDSTTPTTLGNAIIWDELLGQIIDTETGEVVKRDWFLEKLGWAEFPTEPSREAAEAILDVIHTYYLDPAKRYREQAEKLAGPLEKRAEDWNKVFGPYLDLVGADNLPKVKSGAKAGEYRSKTLDLATGSISWRKDGGITCVREDEYHVWLNEKKAELQVLRGKGTPEADEEAAALEKKYGLKLKTEMSADRELIKKLADLPPGWKALPVNEFAIRTIK